MNPLQFLNMDESMKGTDGSPVESQSDAAFSSNVICDFKVTALFVCFSPLTGLRFLRALRLIQFSEILQFLNILKTR